MSAADEEKDPDEAKDAKDEAPAKAAAKKAGGEKSCRAKSRRQRAG